MCVIVEFIAILVSNKKIQDSEPTCFLKLEGVISIDERERCYIDSSPSDECNVILY